MMPPHRTALARACLLRPAVVQAIAGLLLAEMGASGETRPRSPRSGAEVIGKLHSPDGPEAA
jgi:hypothetical protein